MKLTKSQVPTIREKLKAEQGQTCALCDVSFTTRKRNPKGKLVPAYTATLDHCHSHGHVRAALCNNCNGKEGKILKLATYCQRDGTPLEFLEKLVAYLKKHQTPQTPYIHPDHKTDDEKRLERNKKARLARVAIKARRNINGR